MKWFRKIMAGRNGLDQLGIFTIILLLVLFILKKILTWNIIKFLYIFLSIILYYRIFSKNLNKRYIENQKFNKYILRINSFFRRQKNKIKNMRKYKYFNCPICNMDFRVPRGKGKVLITCPKCKKKIKRRT